MNISEMLDEIRKMSVDERLELVQAIEDSIAEEVEKLSVPQSHLDEIKRRIEAYRDDPKAGARWEEVKARLLCRLRSDL